MVSRTWQWVGHKCGWATRGIRRRCHGRGEPERLVAFLAGMVVAGFVLGLVFTTASWLIGTLIGPIWNSVIGVALVVMGLRMLRLIRFKGIAVRTPRRQVTTPLEVFFFGVPFVFAH